MRYMIIVAGALTAAIIVSFLLLAGWFICGDCIFKNNVKISDYSNNIYEYSDLKQNPLSAYYQIYIIDKNRFDDGKPYLTAYSIGGYVFSPYYPLSEKHFNIFEIGHSYVIERPIFNNDVIPLKEVNTTNNIPAKECWCK